MAFFRVLSGSHSERGKRYTEGDVFESPHPLHEKFKNHFELVKSEPDEFAHLNEDEEPEEVLPKYKIVHVGRARYNVVNIETEEALNEKPLTKKKAQEFLEGVEG